MEHARMHYGEIISCLSDLKEVGLNGCPATLGQEFFINPSTGFHELDDLLLELKLKTDQIAGKFLEQENTVRSMLLKLYETTTAHILHLKEETRKLKKGREAFHDCCECLMPVRVDCLGILYEYRSFLWECGHHIFLASRNTMLVKPSLIPATAETGENMVVSEEKKAKFPGKRKIAQVVALLYVLLKEFKVFDQIKRSDFISLCMAFVKGDIRTVGGYVNVLYPDSTENKEKYPTWDYVEPSRKFLKKLRII